MVFFDMIRSTSSAVINAKRFNYKSLLLDIINEKPRIQLILIFLRVVFLFLYKGKGRD